MTIHSDCTLSSCYIDSDVVIGAKSVILEGARIEKGAMVAPGSVVPPGRLVPAGQLWAGNPIEYVKHLDIGESFTNYSLSYTNTFLGDLVKDKFTVWPSNYLLKPTTKDDLGDGELYEKKLMTDNPNEFIKHYSP